LKKMEISMSRSALKYGLTLFLLTTAMAAVAQDKPTLEIVWPKANSVIAPGDDPDRTAIPATSPAGPTTA
jgi:hypothetical protein